MTIRGAPAQDAPACSNTHNKSLLPFMPGTVEDFTVVASTPEEHKGLKWGGAQARDFHTFPLTMLTALTISKSHANPQTGSLKSLKQGISEP